MWGGQGLALGPAMPSRHCTVDHGTLAVRSGVNSNSKRSLPMKARTLTLTAAVIGLSLGGAAYAAGDMKKSPDTSPGTGTPPATTSQANPASPNTAAGGSDRATTPGNTSTLAAKPAMTSVQAKNLLGADIKNASNETIGEVDSVYLGKDGQVSKVIVGVGGFLGMGERNVAVNWDSLTVADGGETVRTTLTKDQLKAMPEYKYSDKSYSGKLFNDSGVVTN
jgi:sporulation protein YlmC with PRC-barrel domain